MVVGRGGIESNPLGGGLTKVIVPVGSPCESYWRMVSAGSSIELVRIVSQHLFCL